MARSELAAYGPMFFFMLQVEQSAAVLAREICAIGSSDQLPV
jgi:hypothetical protein